jgi:outer membrane protein, multidrug efflux system
MLARSSHPAAVPPRRPLAALGLTLCLCTGCAVGPDYRRPDLALPERHRFAAPRDGTDLGELDWTSVFQDAPLRDLIRRGLTNNADLQAAAARVLQAQAALAAERSRFLPSIGGTYQFSRADFSRDIQLGGVEATILSDLQSNSANLALLDYEIDFWGKIRRANEAARATLLATVEAQRMVEQSLVAGIATTYLRLRAQDLELAIARRTLNGRREALSLIRSREQGGQSALTDVRQAEVLVAEAEAAISLAEREIALHENQIRLLCGDPPGGVRRGASLEAQSIAVNAPAGLPARLLERRPDVRLAEQALIAANARIGVAQAQRLPAVSLTAATGVSSRELGDMLSNPSRMWQVGPVVSLPIFTGGRLLAGVRGSRAARDEADASYRQTVLQALREVSDALVAREKNTRYRQAMAKVVTARSNALELIREKYDNGATSYLEVLYNDQELFASEMTLVRARFEELAAVVRLYRALGGGWDASSLPKRSP